MNTPTAEFEVSLAPGSVKGAMKEAGASSRDLWFVPRKELRIIKGFNVRTRTPDYLEHVEAIAGSVLSEGYYPDKPLAGYVGRDGDESVIYVYEGHTRMEAVDIAVSRGADIEKLPVVVTQSSVSLEDLTVSLVRANSGRDLTPYEKAIVCKRLNRYGRDEKEISERLGFTETYVKDLLLLAGSDPRVQHLVAAGTIAATLAIEILKSKGEKATDYIIGLVTNVQEAGGEKVTKKQTPEAILKRTITKAAPRAIELLEEIYTGEARTSLPEELRTRVGELVAEISEARSNLEDEE